MHNKKLWHKSKDGKITAPLSDRGFGWDAIFISENHTRTFGEMSREEKNTMSMRKIALEKLKQYLAETQ